MNIKELVRHIAKTEGKKSNVKIGDIREIVGIISDVAYRDLRTVFPPEKRGTIYHVVQNGLRRSKKAKKKK